MVSILSTDKEVKDVINMLDGIIRDYRRDIKILIKILENYKQGKTMEELPGVDLEKWL